MPFANAGYYKVRLVCEKNRIIQRVFARWSFRSPRVCSTSSMASLVGLGQSASLTTAEGANSEGGAQSGKHWKRRRTQSDRDNKASASKAQKSRPLNPSTKVFRVYSCNICGFNKQKFLALLAFVAPNPPDAIVLSETNLTFPYTPDYVEELGWRAYIVCGPSKCGSRSGDHSGGVSLFIRNGAFKVEQHILMQNASHQLVNWDLSNSDRGITPRIRISGAYFAPRAKVPLQRTITAFKRLKDAFLHPTLPTALNPYSMQYHIVTGDFNAYCGLEQEAHITQSEQSHIPARVGDADHRPRSAIDVHSNTTEPEQRGFLLLECINELSLLIANGRFERRGSPTPLTTARTIVDYFCVPKQLFGDVITCQVLHDSMKQGQHQGIGTDHKAMMLTLSLPFLERNNTYDAGMQAGHREAKAPRKQYFSDKLKDPIVLNEFREAIERVSPKCYDQIMDLRSQYDAQRLTPQELINQSHALFVSMVQGVAEKVLSSPAPFVYLGGRPQANATDKKQHHTPVDRQALLRDIQLLKDDIKMLKRTEPSGQVDAWWADLAEKTTKLHQYKQKVAAEKTREVDQDVSNNIKSISLSLEKDSLQTAWGIWRHYKSSIATDGCHGLPRLMKTNRLADTDPCRWVAGDLAKSALEGASAWPQHRFAVGSDMRNHPLSPWDEAAADRVEASLLGDHPADSLPTDPSLSAPFTMEECLLHLKRLLPDKSTGPDGISNRMLQSGGEAFQKLLFLHLSNIWDSCTWPDAWTSSLMQPIYKGGGKDRYDPASYRGIFLSNSSLKLLEGVMEARLQSYTEKHDTPTAARLTSGPTKP